AEQSGRQTPAAGCRGAARRHAFPQTLGVSEHRLVQVIERRQRRQLAERYAVEIGCVALGWGAIVGLPPRAGRRPLSSAWFRRGAGAAPTRRATAREC